MFIMSTTTAIDPPVDEQRRARVKDHSIVPRFPYLLISNFFDLGCGLPVVGTVLCPADGWRSVLPSKWVTFPHGKLSHSFDSSFAQYANVDISYSDYIQWNKVNARNSGVVHDDSGSISGTLHDYYNYAFNTNSTQLGVLTNPVALCVLTALVLIIRILKKIFLPRFSALGRKLGRSTHGPHWESDNEDRIIKFGEYVYRLCYHSAVSIYGLWYFHNKSWWNKSQGGTKNLWLLHPNQPVEPGMAWYYLVQCAYNVDALLTLIEISFKIESVNPLAYSSALNFLEKEHVVDESQRKKNVLKMMVRGGCDQTFLWTPLFQIKWSSTVRGDFREMMAHHIVTNCLIFLSSYYRFTRIGSMIFLVHDLSDVPIDMSKLANFVKWKTTTIVCFVTMVLMWIITRLTIFPFIICGSVVRESYEYLVTKGTMDPALHEAYFSFFYFLLGSLVLLHITWFIILLRIGWTLVSKGETHDYSEHKSGEKQKST
jgi:hypothetical protein